jgi:hypothetical protein
MHVSHTAVALQFCIRFRVSHRELQDLLNMFKNCPKDSEVRRRGYKGAESSEEMQTKIIIH